MKKLFMVSILPMLLCFGCNSSKVKSEELTLDNFSTYVATQTHRVNVDGYSYAIHYTYFIGADNCRFNDCTVTYSYTYDGGKSGGGTVPLTISGDGQTTPDHLYIKNRYVNWVIQIEAVTGTVDVYSY